MNTAIGVDRLREWIDRRQRVEQVIDPLPARAIAALMDRDDSPAEGEDDRRSRGFLPPVPLPQAHPFRCRAVDCRRTGFVGMKAVGTFD